MSIFDRVIDAGLDRLTSEPRGNYRYLRTKHFQNVAVGERQLQSDWVMVIAGYEEMSLLIRDAELPEIKRAIIEGSCYGGKTFSQPSKISTHGTIQCSVTDNIGGTTVRSLRKIINAGGYLDVSISLLSESNIIPQTHQIFRLNECLLTVGNTPLSTSGNTEVIKYPMTLTYNSYEV